MDNMMTILKTISKYNDNTSTTNFNYYNDSTSTANFNYYEYTSSFNNESYYDTWLYKYIPVTVSTKNFKDFLSVEDIEENLKDFIRNNVDLCKIYDYGSEIYSYINEKLYDIMKETLYSTQEKNLCFEESVESIYEKIIEDIDIESIYKVIDAIYGY